MLSRSTDPRRSAELRGRWAEHTRRVVVSSSRRSGTRRRRQSVAPWLVSWSTLLEQSEHANLQRAIRDDHGSCTSNAESSARRADGHRRARGRTRSRSRCGGTPTRTTERIVQCCGKGPVTHVVQAVTTFMNFLGREPSSGTLAQAIRNDETQPETTPRNSSSSFGRRRARHPQRGGTDPMHADRAGELSG